MREAENVWVWFCLGSTFTALAVMEFAFGVASVIAENALGALLNGGFGGIFTGLLVAVAVKLWLKQKVES